MSPAEIGENIWVFRSRFVNMLSTLIRLDGERAALVDPPMFADEADEIRGFAGERGFSIVFLILTHAHGDHAYGIAHFPDALVLAQSLFWEFWREIEAADRGFFSRFLPGYELPELRCPNLLLADGSRLRFARELVFRHVPGHSPDGLLVELPEERVWIAGDTVIPTPLISSGSLRELRETLRTLLREFPGGILVPGHGEVLRGEAAREAISANLAYLARLEEVIKRAMAAGMELKALLEVPPQKLGLGSKNPDIVELWIHRENLRRAYEELSGRATEGCGQGR
ncbi:MBL fold metallo-hydrolase [Candidatus Bipolaricaulota sp. J31]